MSLTSHATNSRHNQQGVALITVLMILAIMVTIAATMTGRLTLSLKRTQGIYFSQSVYWYALAAGEYGKLILEDDIEDSDVVSLSQNWASDYTTFPLENGTIGGEIRDMRSCFNLNAISDEDSDSERATGVVQLETLLEEIGVEDYTAETIAESVRDWIDSNDDSDASQGAEDSYYQARSVPHLAANALMVDISELHAVQSVGQQIYQHISPYLCAIPSTEQSINVNTVSVEHAAILYALFERDYGLELSDFESLLEDRSSSGWDSVDDFLAEDMFSDISISDEINAELSVSSEYFQMDGVAEFEEHTTTMQILFHVENSEANVIRYQSGGLK